MSKKSKVPGVMGAIEEKDPEVLHFRFFLGRGTYGPHHYVLDHEGHCTKFLVKLDDCPTVVFKVEDMLAHARALLIKEGCIKDGGKDD